jgi:hypothetical protein
MECHLDVWETREVKRSEPFLVYHGHGIWEVTRLGSISITSRLPHNVLILSRASIQVWPDCDHLYLGTKEDDKTVSPDGKVIARERIAQSNKGKKRCITRSASPTTPPSKKHCTNLL